MTRELSLIERVTLGSQILRNKLSGIFALVLLCALPAHATEQNYRLETLAEGLNYPWSVDFLPNGNILVAELSGTLRTIDKDGHVSDPILGVPSV